MNCIDLDKLRAALDPDIPDDDLIGQAVKAIRGARLGVDGLSVDRIVLYPCLCGRWTVFEFTRRWNGSYARRKAIEVEHSQYAEAIYQDILDLNADTFRISETECACEECCEHTMGA